PPTPTAPTPTRATTARPPSRDATLVVADRASHLRPLPPNYPQRSEERQHPEHQREGREVGSDVLAGLRMGLHRPEPARTPGTIPRSATETRPRPPASSSS